MNGSNHNAAQGPREQRGRGNHLYSAYKDRLTLLDRIDGLERFALPNLRARYQKQAMLVQLGQGNPQKVESLAQELQAAENDMLVLKGRLQALENFE